MLSNIDKIIDSNLDDAIKMLKELVSFPSVLDEYKENSVAPFGNANKDALEYLLNRAKKDGFVTKNVDNYAGHIEFGTGNDILGILAHLDVVPVNKEEWTSDPFKLDIRYGKMFGRGSVDDKGPLVASYYAMKILKDLGFKLAREKKKWYFHTEEFRKRSKRKLSMDDIRNLYGSTEVQTEERKQLKQA